MIIDTCAAPGNKTTHIASIIKNTGYVFYARSVLNMFYWFFYYNRQIYAFDKDPKRVEILKQRVHQSGACNVQVQHTDFLKVTKVSP